MKMRTETEVAFRNILDSFSSDVVRFTKFRFFIEGFDELASKGNSEAEQIINVMKQFSRMIDIAQRGEI